MPFQSEKQRRYMHANLPEIANRWERDYAGGGITRLKYIYGGISHPDGRRGFPGGSGKEPGMGTSSGQDTSHDRGGQQHQKTAAKHTPTLATSGGGGKPGDHHPPILPTIPKKDVKKKPSRQEKYESDRAARIRQKRIDYMLKRRANKKGFSQKNLNQLTMGSKPGFYGNVWGGGPLATSNVGIGAFDNVSESMLLPKIKPDTTPDYSNVGSRHPFIMNKGTTIQGTRPPDFVAGIPQLGPVQPGSTSPLFTNRGLTEELSTKDYTSEGPYWSDETGEGQWYDADGKPIDNPNINTEFASMIKPIAAVKEDLVKKQSWYKSPLKLKQKTISTALSKDGAEKIQAFKDLKGMVPKGTLTIEKYLDLSKKGKIPSIIAEDMNKQVLKAIKEAGGFGETFQKNWSTGVVEPTFEGGVLDIDESKLQDKEAKKYLEVAEGGVARKNYFHGGILDLNESEEIISDDGNNIELTDYNVAFDEPTGVKSLFQAKDGGRIGFADGPPGGGDPEMYSAPSSDRGPRDDPDRFGPVSTPQTVPSGINIHADTGKEEAPYVVVKGEKVPIDSAQYNNIKANEFKAEQIYKVLRAKDLTTKQKWEKAKYIYGEYKKGKKFLGDVQKGMAIHPIVGMLVGIFQANKLKKDQLAEIAKLEGQMESLEDWDLKTRHHSEDTPYQILEQRILDLTQPRTRDGTGDDKGGPIYAPLTGAVDDEYAQGYYGRSLLDRDNAALFAQLSERWRQEKLAKEQEYRDYGLLPGDDNPLMLQANSGGLANLFRVKNQ